jgi:hypothetical protein
MKNKRGITGVEMIVSFTIFVSFLVFIFVYMNPLNLPASKTLLTSLESAVAENSTIDIDLRPFAINDKGVFEDCFYIENDFGDKFFITDVNDVKVDFGISGEEVLIKTQGKFYNVYIGLGQGTFDASGCSTSALLKKGDAGTNFDHPGWEYSLSVIRKKRFYHKESLEGLKSAYEEDYNKLKQELKFPVTSDFSIIVFDSGKSEIISMTRVMPRVNILVKEFPVEIVDDEGNVERGYMRLITW